MAWIESLKRAIDYMEGNLLKEITIDAIAKEANSSVFHFQRTFALLTDTTVGEYLRRRRLTLAAEDLCMTDERIIDLAYKYGYDTPEAFSKAFRRQHGTSPTEARKSKSKLKSYNRLVIQVSLKGAEPMKYTITEKAGFDVVGLKREFSLVDEGNITGIPELWNEVNQDGTTAALASINDGAVKGILGVCAVNKELHARKAMEYWVAVNHQGDAPEGMHTLSIPASKWAIFEVHGAMPDAMQNMWEKIYTEWFPSCGYEAAGTPEFELYTNDDPSSPDCYSEIWIPVK